MGALYTLYLAELLDWACRAYKEFHFDFQRCLAWIEERSNLGLTGLWNSNLDSSSLMWQRVLRGCSWMDSDWCHSFVNLACSGPHSSKMISIIYSFFYSALIFSFCAFVPISSSKSPHFVHFKCPLGFDLQNPSSTGSNSNSKVKASQLPHYSSRDKIVLPWSIHH